MQTTRVVALAFSGGLDTSYCVPRLAEDGWVVHTVHVDTGGSTLAERAVKLARAQLGVPYVWGGSSPAGFDCSGLVSWVYGRLGISLPHNAAALYDVGRPVPLSEMRPGDLVFFSGLGHVGLYVGNGRMIHAPQSGRNVEIEALDARSYPPVGARRVTRL